LSFLEPTFFLFFCLFYPAFLWLAQKARTASFILLFGASCFFYAFAGFSHLPLLLFSNTVAYSAGIWIQRTSFRRSVLALSCVVLAAPLVLFKYASFFFPGFALNLGIPLGISFFTFQNLSYTIDVYRGMPPERNFLLYQTYGAFFPHLAAGPIVRARTFLPQLRGDFLSKARLRPALFYIAGGYAKKILADRLAGVVDPVFAQPGQAGSGMTWTAVAAYSLQIYLDFSGYTDIAIGVARLCGFELPENFRFPYSASSFRDFWRRWHISLSTWLRDYIYIPLGGSRKGAGRLFLAVVGTMTIGGLWHGSSWNFVLWGFLHGILLLLDRLIPEKTRRSGRPFFVLLTFLSVSMLWVLFRARNFADAIVLYQTLFVFKAGPLGRSDVNLTLLGLILVVLGSTLYANLKRFFYRGVSVESAALSLGAIALALVVLSPGSASFLYFIF